MAVFEMSFSILLLKRSQATDNKELNSNEVMNLTVRFLSKRNVITLTKVIKFINAITIIDKINNMQVTEANRFPINRDEAAKKSLSGWEMMNLKNR